MGETLETRMASFAAEYDDVCVDIRGLAHQLTEIFKRVEALGRAMPREMTTARVRRVRPPKDQSSTIAPPVSDIQTASRVQQSPRALTPPVATRPESWELLDTTQAATILKLGRQTLAKYRCLGGGPKFVKIGAKVTYRMADIDEWIASHGRQRSTSEVARGI